MASRALIKALVAVTAIIATVKTAHAVNVELKTLILTVPGYNVDFMEATLDGLGAPYAALRFDQFATPRLNLTDLLWAADGTARYAAYVMYPNIEAMGHLTRSEVDTLWDFQRRAGARSVKFGAWPTNVGFDPDVTACSSADVPMAFTAAAPLGGSGINPTAPLSCGGLYRCPGVADKTLPTCSMWANDFAATGIHPPCNSTPVLMIGAHVGGALVQYADGRESLAFMHDCAAFSTSCMALGHLAVSWMLRDIVPGERRALLTVQLDDFLLATEFDASALGPAGQIQYRATVADLQAHQAWHKALMAKRPNVDIRLDLPFNGNGILEAVANNPATAGSPINPIDVDDRSCLDMPEYVTLGCSCWFVGTAACPSTAPDFCRNCTKDWAKPLGFGANRASKAAATNNATWSAAAFAAGDPLAAWMMDPVGGAGDDFFFSHHTFSHQNLDNATTYDTDIQIELNIQMARYLGVSNRPTFSKRCMVTPQISGLRNGDALASLARHGITCGTGDNTWPFLKNAANPYHMLYTTPEVNGYGGFAILPRFATEIYYNCSTPEQNMKLYNALYQSYFGAPSTIDDLMAREAARVVRDGLLKLRHDPHMMHQANLAILDGSGRSLAMRWVDAVLDAFSAYASWPVASLSIDDLMAAFEARQRRDACALAYTLDVEPTTGAVRGLTIASAAAPGGGGCAAPLMTGTGAVGKTYDVPQGGSARFEVTGLSWAVQAAA